MSRPRVSVTSSGPIWSAKHHAPTVRRPMRGRARRTRMAPTTESRLGVISTQAGLTALAWASVGEASTAPTGPLMASLCAAAGTVSSSGAASAQVGALEGPGEPVDQELDCLGGGAPARQQMVGVK